MISREELQQWSNALKSGEFTQCRRVLKDNGRHCCLGVLKDVLLTPEHIEKCYDAIRDLIGCYKSFMDMNDNKWYSFQEIASVIDGVVEKTNPGDLILFECCDGDDFFIVEGVKTKYDY